jgi:hypothetical protein
MKRLPVWLIIDEKSKKQLGIIDGCDSYYKAYVEACELLPDHKKNLEVIRDEPLEVM